MFFHEKYLLFFKKVNNEKTDITYLQICPIYLIEEDRILLSVFVFVFLNIAFIKIYEENSVTQIHVLIKGRTISTAFYNSL